MKATTTNATTRKPSTLRYVAAYAVGVLMVVGMGPIGLLLASRTVNDILHGDE